MRLLVSVCDRDEAAAAIGGGADIIDTKDPAMGPLAPVALSVFEAIAVRVGGVRPLSAALGDAEDEDAIGERAAAFSRRGAQWVKVGFAGIRDASRIERLLRATVESAAGAGVIAVAYCDANPKTDITPAALSAVALRAGACGVLVDTINKSGHGLRTIMSPRALRAWVSSAHDLHLLAAVAGRVAAEDLPAAAASGADVVGVRGAACEGGRTGRVSADRVGDLARRVASYSPTMVAVSKDC